MSKKIKVIPMLEETLTKQNIPVPSVKTIPEWYKSIPSYSNGDKKLRVIDNSAVNSTIKHCSPFLDAMTAGYMVTLSEDVNVSWVSNKPYFESRTQSELVTDHSLNQTSNLEVPEGYYKQVMKWNNNYSFDTPDGYSLWCTHPSNRLDLPFLCLNGFVDTDSYELPIQFPFFIKNEWEGVIEAGTPIAQIIPIKRDSWNMDILEFNEIQSKAKGFKYLSKLERSYKNQHWKKKSYQ